MASRREVFTAIDSERDYQEMRKRRDKGAPFHSAEEFLLYMQDYLTSTIHTASTTWGPEALPLILEGVRKVTTLGVALMEQHGAPQRAGFERDVEYANIGEFLQAAAKYAGVDPVFKTAPRVDPDTNGQLRAAITHAVNYHGLDSDLEMADCDIADTLIGEVLKHLNGETEVQRIDRMTPEERARIGLDEGLTVQPNPAPEQFVEYDRPWPAPCGNVDDYVTPDDEEIPF